VKKGRHRRYEEARALKRSTESDLQEFIEAFDEEEEEMKPEHAAWAEEFEDEDDDG
jgi:FtsZ-binding cell division protein ZapB